MITAADIIKKYEGYRDKAYKCPAGKWTIGYGSTFNPFNKVEVKKGDFIMEIEAYDWLLFHIAELRKNIVSLLPYLTTCQTEALISFCFNIGIGSFKKSTMYKLLKGKEIALAANEFDKWVHVGKKKLEGLVKRRQAEKDLFVCEYICEQANKVCSCVSLKDRVVALKEKLKSIFL